MGIITDEDLYAIALSCHKLEYLNISHYTDIRELLICNIIRSYPSIVPAITQKKLSNKFLVYEVEWNVVKINNNAVNRVSTDKLTWKVLLGSQVIADESDILKKLPKQLCENFMKCNDFVRDFTSRDTNKLPRALLHDRRSIKFIRNDSWNNSAFSPEEAEALNEGTYLTNLIVPAIRTSLKNLPHGKFTYISTYERQSIASADRRKRSGRRPDIIFVMMDRGKKYELIYTECSRLFCTEQKIKDDAIKIWRETNDRMYWVYKGQRPEKDEFGVIGLQVAGSMLRLTVLIRDGANVDRYYHLHESRIPVQKSEPAVVVKFIETLLILRNILTVNMSLLPHGSTPKSNRQKEDSTTVDSE
ncbi:hypothetical protein C1645_741956 [Glomus cerebriforme]|uniref:Uncharacterized protein n=1 Tax=Glomus cerebriforme TaxID=658196 RepID=A0A397SQI8_9GLOM|nr:hypothetical protein C1645_741956 [Glomus cerebriforme]